MSLLSLALLIFTAAYLAIVTERVHKTIVALTGAALMISLGVLTQEEAFYSRDFGVDYNVIFLLIGMMVIVNVMRKTGLFEVLAILSAQYAGAQPFRMLVVLAVVTAALSSLLDNVTTVLLMAPVTLGVTRRLELNPVPFLISEALASNIGGTATLVGDPPNIMISSKAGLTYVDFLSVMTPIAVIIMAVFIGVLWLVLGRRMHAATHLQQAVLALNPRDAVRDPILFRRCLWLMGLTTAGFVAHGQLHLEPATVALLGASLFMLLGHGHRGHDDDPDALDYLTDVEWKTIFFFVGLFILVGGLVKVGAIGYLADQVVQTSRGNVAATTITVLWGSAMLSAIIDNIPYVAAMNPLIVELARSLHPGTTDYAALVHQPDILPLWWALALGACLGGNGTIIGASANVVIVDMARRAGHPISFVRFMMAGLPVMVGSILLSSLYLWLRFFL
jgi:Na+/H+ antiporter NhaD/arsenite permease-like protein